MLSLSPTLDRRTFTNALTVWDGCLTLKPSHKKKALNAPVSPFYQPSRFRWRCDDTPHKPVVPQVWVITFRCSVNNFTLPFGLFGLPKDFATQFATYLYFLAGGARHETVKIALNEPINDCLKWVSSAAKAQIFAHTHTQTHTQTHLYTAIYLLI